MILFIAWTLATSAIVNGEGYDFKAAAPAPVIEHGNLNGFQPIAPPGTPCAHSPAALIQAQSLGRILNHPPHQHHHHHHQQANVDNNLDTAASNSQSQAVSVNSHIVVGEQNVGGKTQIFRPGQGYVQAGPPSPPLLHYQTNNFNPGLGQQLPPQLPAQQFNPAHLPTGKVVPSQLIGSQAFHRPLPPPPAGGPSHVHHHYSVSGPQHFAGGHQYAAGFSAQSAQSSAGLHGVAQTHPPGLLPPLAPPSSASFHGPATYQPSAPGPIGGFAAPRPVQHFGGGGSSANYQPGSGSYAGSYSHSSHSAQNLNTNAFSTFNGAQHGGSFNGGGQTANLHFGAGPSGALGGQLGQVIQETFANAPLDPSVEKHIYVHVPPEDLEEHDAKHAIQAALPAKTKKHYKIIFIKAPSAPTPNYAQLAAAAAPQTEEKTLVYVLVKKPDEPSIEELQQLTQNPVKMHKPEVYFIKYKTRKEGETGAAEYAGISQYSNGGGAGDGGGGGGFGGGIESTGITNEYLPPSGSSSSSSSYSTDGDGAIDIRSDALGESGSTSSSSTSYSTSASSSSSSSSTSASTSPSSGFIGHSAYGVPLN